MFETIGNIIHSVVDVGVMLAIIIHLIVGVMKALFSPLIWLFTFLYNFFVGVINFSYSYQPAISFDPRVLTILNAIPYFATMMTVIVVVFYILLLFKIFRILTR